MDLDWIWKEQVAHNELPPPVYPVSPKLDIDSKMIDPEKHFDFIKNKCFSGRQLTFTKIFRGSEDGFTASKFH